MRSIPTLLQEKQGLMVQIRRLLDQVARIDLELTAILGHNTAVPVASMGADLFNATVARQRERERERGSVRERDTVGSRIVAVAERLIQLHNRPVSTAEVMAALKSSGVEVPGKTPINNVSAHLSRMKGRIVRKPEGWYIVEKQEPPEGGS